MCRIDVERLLLEVKQKGEPVELVDLRPLLGGALLLVEATGESVQLVD